MDMLAAKPQDVDLMVVVTVQTVQQVVKEVMAAAVAAVEVDTPMDQLLLFLLNKVDIVDLQK